MTCTRLMGFDLGGGSVRCLLLDVDSGDVTAASNAWRFPRASEAPGLGFSLDLDSMWQLIAQTSRECLALAGAKAEEVAGVGVSALRFGNVILDRMGSVKFAVPNRDARGAGEYLQLAASAGEEVLAETGLWPMPIHASARLKWLAQNNPAALSPDHRLLSVSDWMNYRLCGEMTTDLSQAGCTGLFNLTSRSWNWDRIASLGLPAEMFIEVQPSGSPMGEMTAKAATELGLRTGTPVGLAGADTQCALFGVGAIAAGEAAIVAGTTAPVQRATDAPVIDPGGRLWSGHHVVPDRWVIESNGGPMGETLSWMSRLLYDDAPDPEARLFAEASSVEVGAAGMFSTLGAEVMNARAPSIPVGQLTLSHMTTARDPRPRRFLARAVVEGYACAVRANLEQLNRVVPGNVQRFFIAGGLSRSDVFVQIVANILECEVIPASGTDSTALGAAMCSAVSMGLFDDVESAAKALGQTREVRSPDPQLAEANAELYAGWSSLRTAGAESTAPVASALVMPWVFRMSD